MKLVSLFVVFACVLGCFCQESGETETIRFTYEHATNMLVVTRQAICYMFVLTDAEKAQVHDDAALKSLELSLLARIADPNTVLTPVPHNAIHTNLHKECGRDMAKYYIIQ